MPTKKPRTPKTTKAPKPVKAWGVKLPDGKLQAEAWPKKHNAFCATPSGGETVRVTVSVDDPRANRISAAERRVVEAAKKVLAHRRDDGSYILLTVRVEALDNALNALQHAKGAR